MFVPLGALLAMWIAPQPRRPIDLPAFAVASLLGCLWAIGVNFAQLWFPARTVILNLRRRGIHRRDRRRAAVEHAGCERPDMVAAARDRRQRQREGGAERLRGPVPDRQPDAVRLRDQRPGAVREVRFRSLRAVARSHRLRTDIVQRQVRLHSRCCASLRLVVRVPAATVGERLAGGRAGRAGCRREHRVAAFPDGQRREPGGVGGAAQLGHGAGRSDVRMAKAPGRRRSGSRGRPVVAALLVPYAAALAYAAGWFTTAKLGVAAGLARFGDIVWMPFYYEYFSAYQATMFSAIVYTVLYAPVALLCWLWVRRRDRIPLVPCRAGRGADRGHRRDEQGVSCRPAARLHGRLLRRSVGDAGACRPALRLAIVTVVAHAATRAGGRAAGRFAAGARRASRDRIRARSGCRERGRPAGGSAAGRHRGGDGDRVPGRIVGARGGTRRVCGGIAALSDGDVPDRNPHAVAGARPRPAHRPLFLGRVRRSARDDAGRPAADGAAGSCRRRPGCREWRSGCCCCRWSRAL